MDPAATFYVKDNAGNPVAAKFLRYNGEYIVDPNQQDVKEDPKLQIYTKDADGKLTPVQNANPNNYLIVPTDFDIDSAASFAAQVAKIESTPDIGLDGTDASYQNALNAMIAAFKTAGTQDLQRNYDGKKMEWQSGDVC